jgi:uncharacterized OB-fold protein
MDGGVLRRDGRTDPFFDGTAENRLMIRRCEACDRWLGPGETSCPGCGTEELAWAQAAGDASLVTWTIAHGRSPGEEKAVLALVELAEGPWIYTRLDRVSDVVLAEGLALRARYLHPDEGESDVIVEPAVWTE